MITQNQVADRTKGVCALRKKKSSCLRIRHRGQGEEGHELWFAPDLSENLGGVKISGEPGTCAKSTDIVQIGQPGALRLRPRRSSEDLYRRSRPERRIDSVAKGICQIGSHRRQGLDTVVIDPVFPLDGLPTGDDSIRSVLRRHCLGTMHYMLYQDM
jgi:hypothetical protein